MFEQTVICTSETNSINNNIAESEFVADVQLRVDGVANRDNNIYLSKVPVGAFKLGGTYTMKFEEV